MVWKDVPGYEGLYQVSDTGSVRSVDRLIVLKTRDGKRDRPCRFKGKLLKPCKEIRKYGKIALLVSLSKEGVTDNMYVHRLVAIAFIPNPNNKPEVNHKDGNPCNNRVSNLEWVTHAENIQHAFENKLISTQKPVLQLSPKTGNLIARFDSESEACRAMGVTQGKVLRSIQRDGTCKGYKWKYE